MHALYSSLPLAPRAMTRFSLAAARSSLTSLLRLTAIVSVCLLVALLGLPASPARADESTPVLTESTAAYVTDAHGNVLFDFNGQMELPMASITKIMTTMVALDSKIPLDKQITFVTNEYQEDAQLAGYADGDTLTFGELLRVSLIFSGNDTASNIAYVVAGTEEEFAKLMNEKAQQIGLEHTHFTNAHGLEEEGHYSCAADLCKMGQYAMEHYPFIRETVSTPSIDVVIRGQHITLYSTDELMDTYQGLLGIKTGKTESGTSFLGSARRNSVTLYSCSLCCYTDEARFEDTRSMLDWAFEQYHPVTYSHEDWMIRALPWQDGFWLKCPVSATSNLMGMVYKEGEVTSSSVMGNPHQLIGATGTYGTTFWNQGERLVGSVEYRSKGATRVGAWNPLVLPLFEDTKGMTL